MQAVCILNRNVGRTILRCSCVIGIALERELFVYVSHSCSVYCLFVVSFVHISPELDVPGKLGFFLYDPWVDDELEAACRALSCLDSFVAALGVGSDLIEMLKDVRSRTQEVGGLPRWVFCNRDTFNERMGAVKTVC